MWRAPREKFSTTCATRSTSPWKWSTPRKSMASDVEKDAVYASGEAQDGRDACHFVAHAGSVIHVPSALVNPSVRKTAGRITRQMIFYATLLGIWALLAKLKVWPPYLFPAPWSVGEVLWDGLKDHSFLIGIAATMKRMLIGYGLSVLLGMILGLALASYKFLEETLGGLMVSLQSLPSICWVPLAILWFGLTE